MHCNYAYTLRYCGGGNRVPWLIGTNGLLRIAAHSDMQCITGQNTHVRGHLSRSGTQASTALTVIDVTTNNKVHFMVVIFIRVNNSFKDYCSFSIDLHC